MKLFLKILACIIPIVILVNLYRFVFTQDVTGHEYVFFGIHAFVDHISTFPGISQTLDTFDTVKALATSISTTGDFWTNVVDFFKMIGNVFIIPVKLLIDVCLNLGWFIALFTGIM